MYGKTLASTFVQRSLPPVCEIIYGVEQPIGTQPACSYAEYGNLLPHAAGVCSCTAAGNENSMVGVGADIRTGTHVLYEQAYIPYGVVFAFACCSHNGYIAFTLPEKKPYRFCLVIALLFGNAVQNVCVFLSVDCAYGVPVTYYGVGDSACCYVIVGCTVTAYNVSGVVKYLQRLFRCGVTAGSQYNVVKIIFHGSSLSASDLSICNIQR